MATWVQMSNNRSQEHYAMANLGCYDLPNGDVETIYGICYREPAYPASYPTPYVWEVRVATGDPFALESSFITLNETATIEESHAAAEAAGLAWLQGDKIKPDPIEWE